MEEEKNLVEEGLWNKRLAVLELRQMNRLHYQQLAQIRLLAQETRHTHTHALSSLHQARLEWSGLSQDLKLIQQSHSTLLQGQSDVPNAKVYLEGEIEARKVLKGRLEEVRKNRVRLEKELGERRAAYEKLRNEIDLWLNKGSSLLL